jgi:hypothetical protein
MSAWAAIAVWTVLVIMTAFAPRVSVGRWTKIRHWSPLRCRRTALAVAFILYLACGATAEFGFSALPFAWAFQPWPFHYSLAGGAWVAAVMSAPLIAQRVAGIPSPGRRLW